MTDASDDLGIDPALRDELRKLARKITTAWHKLEPFVERALLLEARVRKAKDYFELERGEFFNADEAETWRDASGRGAVLDALYQFLDVAAVEERMDDADEILAMLNTGT